MIDLTEAKLHLRVDIDDDDTLIQSMIDAATAAAADYLGMDVEDFGGSPSVPMPAPVRAAILLQVGDLYEFRERQLDRAMYRNNTYERLLNPYRAMDV
jgi:uncharacterized phage protein (predicted DNA packaging)